MAQWDQNPPYTELEEIMTEKATRDVGLTAEQFNKVMENIRYLKNLYDLYAVEIGTVQTIYAPPGTDFDVSITHRQVPSGDDVLDYLDFVFTIAVAEISTSVSARSVEASEPAKVNASVTRLPTNKGYNFDFNFEIPKGEIGDADCTSSSSSGVVSYTLVHDADKTFTSSSISRLTLTVPSTAVHGFFSGVNFKVSSTPTVLSFVNNSSFPLKLLRRGVLADSYAFTAGKTVMLVVTCDGLNVYCNLIEV